MLKQIISYSLLTGMLVMQDVEARLTSENQEDNFDKKMDEAIARQEQEVKNLKNNATRKDIAPTWNTKLELENAIIQLEVKKTLVGNFRGTESLKSSLVRERLLQVLNKQMITTGDLADLQSLVLEEKAKMRAAQPGQESQPIKTESDKSID